MGAMFGNLDHTAELEAPSVRAGRFTCEPWLCLDSSFSN